MAITFPSSTGTTPVTAVAVGVPATRSVRYEVSIVPRVAGMSGTILPIDGVMPGGSIHWSSVASIHSGGTINVIDLDEGINWLSSFVQIVAYIADDNAPELAYPLGVFLPSAPVGSYSDGTRTWQVELLDKLSILDDDIPVDGDGHPLTYTVSAGSNILTTVTTIVQSAAGTGSDTLALGVGDEVTAADITWTAGTTKLQIVNDLLDAGNYFSLWTDGYGRFRATKYQAPSGRSLVYSLASPFTTSTAQMDPAWEHDEDLYSVPNRVVLIGTGDGTTEALVSSAEDADGTRFSYTSRGRWITRVDTGVEAADQGTLDALAQARLVAAQNATSTLMVSHLLLPDLLMNSAVAVDIGDVTGVATVQNIEVPLDPLELCKTTLQEVIS